MFQSLHVSYIVAEPAMIDRLIATAQPWISAAMIENNTCWNSSYVKASGTLYRPDACGALGAPAIACRLVAGRTAGRRVSLARAGRARYMLTLPDGTDVEAAPGGGARAGTADISSWFADPARRALLLGFACAASSPPSGACAISPTFLSS